MIRKYYTDDELISELHRFVEENEKVPTARDMFTKNGYPSVSTYKSRFGSFNNVLEIAGLEINQTQRVEVLDGTEICSYCGCTREETSNWIYDLEGNRFCNKHGRRGKPDYVKGELDINSNTGLGRAIEILITRVLKIPKKFDCNRKTCKHSIDLYHDKYKKIDAKGSILNYKYNIWMFHFDRKQDADTYICIGLSSNRKSVEHVWIVPNDNYVKNLVSLSIRDGRLSLLNHSKWEVDVKPYNDMWQTMKLKTCKIMVDKKKEETEEEKRKHEEFKKAYFKKLGIEE